MAVGCVDTGKVARPEHQTENDLAADSLNNDDPRI
jgi:hypothetical protein